MEFTDQIARLPNKNKEGWLNYLLNFNINSVKSTLQTHAVSNST